MKLNGHMTISGRRNEPDGQEKVYISIVDQLSGVRFVEVAVPYAEMMAALTGLARRPVEMEVEDLHKVGKECKIKTRYVAVPCSVLEQLKINEYDSQALEKFAEERLQKQGWELRSHLRSQDSIRHDNERKAVVLKLKYLKYV